MILRGEGKRKGKQEGSPGEVREELSQPPQLNLALAPCLPPLALGPRWVSSGDREDCGVGYRVVQEEGEVTASSPWLRKERPCLCPSAPFPHIRRAGKGDFPEGQGPRREVWHFLHQCPCQGQMEFSGGLSRESGRHCASWKRLEACGLPAMPVGTLRTFSLFPHGWLAWGLLTIFTVLSFDRSGLGCLSLLLERCSLLACCGPTQRLLVLSYKCQPGSFT